MWRSTSLGQPPMPSGPSARRRIKAAANNNDWGFYSFFKSGWKRFYLKWYEDALPSARALCPKTVALVSAIPNVLDTLAV